MNISRNEHPPPFFFLNVHHENYSYRRPNRSLASICIDACSLVHNDLDYASIMCGLYAWQYAVGWCVSRLPCTRCACGRLARRTGSYYTKLHRVGYLKNTKLFDFFNLEPGHRFNDRVH